MESVDHANYVLDKHIPRLPHSGPTALLSHTVTIHPLSIWLMNSSIFRFYCHHCPTKWRQQRQQRCHIQRPSARAHWSLTVSGCDTMSVLSRVCRFVLGCNASLPLPSHASFWDATRHCCPRPTPLEPTTCFACELQIWSCCSRHGEKFIASAVIKIFLCCVYLSTTCRDVLRNCGVAEEATRLAYVCGCRQCSHGYGCGRGCRCG
jgi:hypothetical protein